MNAWDNAINKEFVEGIIDFANSLKEDYTSSEVEEFYKELGRHISNEVFTTYDEDIIPD
ncbi:MAG: hypothetical protein Unbinned2299contig1000_59 [Prokaryotic dsDNA virus sp.]|nr:MAG: hypothetical protein Unbinned2299contig1000_59 [Prokaryotic dsDNA virus sp.]|tara:strand:+ start:203 stop:379 length:177 start_codon:yes stop_codon:yes gene_type:complete